jgi:hypothetical protein
MSKAYWHFDYANEYVLVSKDINLFNFQDFEYIIDFSTNLQYSIKVAGKIGTKNINFTFDTGSNSEISVSNDFDYYQELSAGKDFARFTGTESVGVHGAGRIDNFFYMRTNLFLNEILFEKVTIKGARSNLIGNEFLRNYTFILDWKSKRIFMKQNNEKIYDKLFGYGFSYTLQNEKIVVMNTSIDHPTAIRNGDEIIGLNSINFLEMSVAQKCNHLLNRKAETDSIEVLYVRNTDTMQIILPKFVYIP